ncbi:MAG: dephospho-CoA kinase [Anaerovoracaceae bacterium]
MLWFFRRRRKAGSGDVPKIIERIDDEISLLRRKSGIDGILLDAPLLFEAGLDTRCDAVLVLVADEEVRISRVCARDGMTPEEVRDRIRNQMSDNEKIKRADAVIDNSDGIQELKENIDEFLDDFLPEIQRHKSTQKNL